MNMWNLKISIDANRYRLLTAMNRVMSAISACTIHHDLPFISGKLMNNKVYGYGGEKIAEVAVAKQRIQAGGTYPLRAYEKELRESFWTNYLRWRIR